MSDLQVDLCIIGAGAAGLSLAAGASQLGRRVALIERGKMGGDCLNVGCVPSKALLAAAKAAQAGKGAGRFGIAYGPASVDFAAVMAHVRGAIATITPNDSAARYRGLGVEVIEASARFIAPNALEAGGRKITAKHFVIATGTRPLVPALPGLAGTPYLTNETLFDLKERPDHLLVLGGGPIGCEMAQAFCRLGSKVSLIDRRQLLPKDDPEAVELVRQSLAEDGVELLMNSKALSVEKTAGGVRLILEREGERLSLNGSHLLLATGRRYDFADLDPAKAGLELDEKGRLKVGPTLRTTNPRVYAAGDAAGGYAFTHLAGYHAAYLLKRLLFRLPGQPKAAIPWVTYCEPEVAQVGLTEQAAIEKGLEIRLSRWPFAENDRAIAESETTGFVKVIASPKGRILGATIVGEGAGELIQPWCLAIDKRLKLGAIAQVVLPYPTLGEASKRAAGAFFMGRLFSPRTKQLVRWLSRLW